jgi:hypothetical protein
MRIKNNARTRQHITDIKRLEISDAQKKNGLPCKEQAVS